MITLLLALHPKSWRSRYGDEFRALLEAQPMTSAVVLDVLGNAARQQVRSHPILLQIAMAMALSAGVEWVALTHQLTDNILWAPDSGPRAVLLAALLLPWLPLATDLVAATRQRRPRERLLP
ncbi:hypothetical protein [Rhodococcus sp. H29-C3]|uniref:hypothetical protein n=1 Tax=Rhodococcus sp. H29-C3 TaxID=3046307 RepID=UPI0024B94D3C|nr:hypothetical protein [Rhodococcus sp. H29-C3]MDJ0363264.1 hypothetical protein [Rhodococcus sp. H29-C3]